MLTPQVVTCFAVMIGLFFASAAIAQHDLHNHPPHNMILLGKDEVFASHIVYKEPHNFQVILKVDFDSETLAVYKASKNENPNQLFIFLLDSMDIKAISEQTQLSGKILFENANDERIVFRQNVVLNKEQFKIVYFDELPLSLEKKPKPVVPVIEPGLFKGPEDDCCNMHSPKKGC